MPCLLTIDFDRNLIYILFFSVISIFLLVIGVVAVILLASRQRSKQQLAYEQELRTTQQEIQSQLLNQVSSELHDNIGQLLTLLRIQMETVKMKNAGAGISFNAMDQTLSDTIRQVRALSHSLSSDMLDQKGLLETIINEVSRLQQIGHFKLVFVHDHTEPSLEKDQKLMVFRIFQELINNVFKHAAAQNVSISLRGHEQFTLEITDDGNGYNPDQLLVSSEGAGLKNILRRAELAHLNCRLNSAPGRGSSCFIQDM